jgi:hypothetical protein
MSIKSLKLRRPMRRYDGGGLAYNQPAPTYQPALQQPVEQTDKFGNGMQKTGQVTGLVGTIRSAVNQVAEPIRYNAEAIDPETGGFQNARKAENMSAL